jgi:hypothetical protein
MNCPNCNKTYKIIRIIFLSIIGILLFYEYLEVFFLYNGGIIIWAHPDLPISDWGQLNIWYPVFMVFFLLSLFALILWGYYHENN